jgi:hypothetical protein
VNVFRKNKQYKIKLTIPGLFHAIHAKCDKIISKLILSVIIIIIKKKKNYLWILFDSWMKNVMTEKMLWNKIVNILPAIEVQCHDTHTTVRALC